MHAIFYEQGERWLLEDRCSTNGTFLEGVRLPPNEKRHVNDGATLRISDVVALRFFEAASFWSFCSLVRGSSSEPHSGRG